jgi:hypothetical protein
MHGIQIRWTDGRETEHWYEQMGQWETQCSLAQLLGALVRFWSAIAQEWTRWF